MNNWRKNYFAIKLICTHLNNPSPNCIFIMTYILETFYNFYCCCRYLDCFYRTNQLHFALLDYKQALELDPSQWGSYCRVAVVCSEIGVKLFSQENYQEAERYFTVAIHHNPKVARFYLCRARARLELKVRTDLLG